MLRTTRLFRTTQHFNHSFNRVANFSTKNKPRILITGGLGQIGSELAVSLKDDYHVIVTDVRKPPQDFQGTFHFLDVGNRYAFEQLVVENRIDWLVHLTSLLSASGEKNPQLAIEVNVGGLHNALDIAHKHRLRIFAPSSIAAFGPTTPRDNTPDLTLLFPTTIYGVTKVYLELLGEYYHNKFGVDFRSVRYPGIISAGTPPGGGTTDYAVEIFYDALKKGNYTCFLKEDSALPMMYMPDCLKGTVDLLTCDPEKLKRRVYNLTSVSFTPRQIAQTIKKYIPSFQIEYKPDFRQNIADSWPKSIDDSNARKDWEWKPNFDLDAMVRDMLLQLSAKFKRENPTIQLMELKNIR